MLAPLFVERGGVQTGGASDREDDPVPENEPVTALAATDLTALIGIVAQLTGLVMGGALDQQDVATFARRAAKDGLLSGDVADGAVADELTAAYERLIGRLRFALGERY